MEELIKISVNEEQEQVVSGRELQRKVRKAHSFRCGMDSMFLTFN